MGIILLLLFLLAISLGIWALVVAIATIVVKKVWFSGKARNTAKATSSNSQRPRQSNSEFREFHSRNDKQTYSPTGWVFNEKTKLWEPPDYINQESKQKWAWDDEKQIWIDQEKK